MSKIRASQNLTRMTQSSESFSPLKMGISNILGSTYQMWVPYEKYKKNY